MKMGEYQKWNDILRRAARQIAQKPSKVSFGYALQAVRQSPFRPMVAAKFIEDNLGEDAGKTISALKVSNIAQQVTLERMRA